MPDLLKYALTQELHRSIYKEINCWPWWHMPLITTLGKQRQMDFCEFNVSLVYRELQDSQGCYTEQPYLKTYL